METHQPDPTSDHETAPWGNLSRELSSLGDRLYQTYLRIASEEGPGEEELSEAVATLAAAWDDVAASLSTALGHPETRAHLKRAAGSLVAALGATISDLGNRIDHAQPAGGAQDGAGRYSG